MFFSKGIYLHNLSLLFTAWKVVAALIVWAEERIADNNNKTMQYIFPLLIFPSSHSPAYIPLSMFSHPS